MNEMNNLRILIIDDNPEIHKDFIKVLSFDNSTSEIDVLNTELLFGTKPQISTFPKYDLECALQGQEGVEKIKHALEAKNPFAIAFVDIRMPPGWDGIETIQHILELDTDIQLVICTAYSDYTWEKTVEKLGMRDNLLVLKKPFDVDAVRQLACALTKKWQWMHEVKSKTSTLEDSVSQRTLALQKSLSFSLIRATLESSADGIMVMDNDNLLVDYNAHFAEMWKLPQTLLNNKQGLRIFEYIQNQLQQSELLSKHMESLHSEPEAILNEILTLKNNSIYEVYSQPHKLKGEIIGRVWNFHNITKCIHPEL